MTMKFLIVIVMATAWVAVSSAAGYDDDQPYMETKASNSYSHYSYAMSSGSTPSPMMSLYLATGFALLMIVRRFM